jgi:hypothetical protein
MVLFEVSGVEEWERGGEAENYLAGVGKSRIR